MAKEVSEPIIGTAHQFIDGRLHEQKCYGTFEEDLPEKDFRFRILFVQHNGDFKMHAHEYSELVFVFGGRATHVTEIEEYELEAGDVFVISGNRRHGFRKAQNLDLCNVMFDPAQFLTGKSELEEMMGFHALFDLQPRTKSRDSFRERLHLNPEQMAEASDLLSRIRVEHAQKKEGRQLVIASSFTLLVTFICRLYGSEKKDTASPLTQMAKVVSHIQKHFRESIRMDELGRIANLSVSQLQRKFKKTYDTSPVQYINKLRIHEACEMLKRHDLSITDIAYQCGFASSSFFSTQFRNHLGESPTSYRDRFSIRNSNDHKGV